MNTKALNYLNNNFNQPVRDPLWQNILISKEIKKLINLEAFQNLSGIKQLGPAFHVYPGATHTRLNHSLGVFHLSKRLITNLLKNPNCPALSIEGITSFLCAALLHDLGHFPYAHSLKELPLKEHEEITAEIIQSSPIKDCINKVIGGNAETTALIVDTNIKTDNEEIFFFRKILSGVLDPDKLDYLNRDAFFCGVPYGIQDTDFAISKILPSKNGIGIDKSGITAVENILFSKYLMYRSVYWHKTLRSATAMIKKAVVTALEEKAIQKDELYGLTDYEFFSNFSESVHPVMKLIDNVYKRELYKCAIEIPFKNNLDEHKKILNLEYRLNLETRLANKYNCSDMIIDIPEPISFEVELPIVSPNNEIIYTKSDSVFSKPVIDGFTSSLRKIRIYLPQKDIGRLNERNFSYF